MNTRCTVAGCTTTARCKGLCNKLIQSGIARVVSNQPLPEFRERWIDEMRSASAMFLEAGISFDYLEAR